MRVPVPPSAPIHRRAPCEARRLRASLAYRRTCFNPRAPCEARQQKSFSDTSLFHYSIILLKTLIGTNSIHSHRYIRLRIR